MTFADTLLNVFLAIAVDNLSMALELTAEEERAAAEEAAQEAAAVSVNRVLPHNKVFFASICNSPRSLCVASRRGCEKRSSKW